MGSGGEWSIEKRSSFRSDSFTGVDENMPETGCLSIVVLGASGDLAKKKTFPALFHLYRQGFLPPDEVHIFGYARTKISDDDLRNCIRGYLASDKDASPDHAEDLSKFLQLIKYVSGSYNDGEGFQRLDKAISENEFSKNTVEGSSRSQTISLLERTSEFLIYGHGQQRRAIIEAMRLLENKKDGLDPDIHKFGEESNGPQYFKDKAKKWQNFVTQAKAAGKTPAECRKMGDEIGAAIIENYNDTLRSCNALDYHDLISCSAKLLTDFPEVLKECQDSWKAILIDEFQDTSAMQYRLLQILASHSHITIVGNHDQSIFIFNGADIYGFDTFRKDFPGYKEIRLTRNYRSTGCIVEATSSLIKHNIKRCQLKNVLTENSYGSKITVKECYEEAQCAFVVDKILESAFNDSADKCSYGNIAILYRRQVTGKVFQIAFRERRIPFYIHGVAFYRKKSPLGGSTTEPTDAQEKKCKLLQY